MADKATTVEEQISQLAKRGMKLGDIDKAKENLLDIGYYRLGFYWFPFEKNYPKKHNRDHNFKEGTEFDYAIKLYYFDFDLRNIFLRYISRIEVHFRTTFIYHVSNAYKANPFWYVDPSILDQKMIDSNEYQKVLNDLSKEYVIKLDDILSFRLSVQYMSDRITPRPPKIMITNRKYNVKLIVQGFLSRYHNS